MTPPAIPAGIAPARGCSAVARPSKSPSSSSASAASACCRLAHQAPKSGRVPPALTCPAGRPALRVRRRSVCLWTAAFRISARTTSSVIRALCASRSANWSRAAASGIRAATVEHLRSGTPRRPSSVDKSCPAAARSSRYSRYGRELPQLLLVRRPAVLPDEVIGIVARRQHRDVDLEALGDEQFRRSGRRALARRVGIEAEDDFRRRNVSAACACAGVSAVPDEATTLLMPAWIGLRQVEVALDHHRVFRSG